MTESIGHRSAIQVSPRFSVIESDPYPWSFDCDPRPANPALTVIHMQTDFCGTGGVDEMGCDLSLVRAPIEPGRALLAGLGE